MNLRRIGMLGAIATLCASGGYVFVYLYRWEWNRAQVSAAIFVAVEVGLVGWVLADRLHRVERRLDSLSEGQRSGRIEHLRMSAPPPRTGFAWLSRPEQMNVFVPVLMGAGALLSALAWMVERLARATAGRVAEHQLATRLGSLDLPSGGFLATAEDPLAVLRGPIGAPSGRSSR